jgi:hypothetical protein
MATYFRVHSVGDSIISFLRNSYPEPLRSEYPCEFRLISSGELAENENMGTAVTLYLYRTEIDKCMRNQVYTQGLREKSQPLSLALFYLIIVWADSALVEHTITTWVLSQLHQHPILDQSTLSGSGQWKSGDQITIVPMEMSNEDLMRLWDVLLPNYRLSLPYIARVVQIDPQASEEGLPVVATQYGYGDIVDEASPDQS